MKIISIQRPPAFTLEDKYFNALSSASSIAIYAILEKFRYQNINYNDDMIKKWSEDIGITDDEYNNAMNELVKADFLNPITE